MDELLTPGQAAALKGISVATIYRAIEEGRLPAERMLNRFALKRADVEAFEAGSYAGVKRAVKKRGPGRAKSTGPAA